MGTDGRSSGEPGILSQKDHYSQRRIMAAIGLLLGRRRFVAGLISQRGIYPATYVQRGTSSRRVIRATSMQLSSDTA
jgi:hypothetical protein